MAPGTIGQKLLSFRKWAEGHPRSELAWEVTTQLSSLCANFAKGYMEPSDTHNFILTLGIIIFVFTSKKLIAVFSIHSILKGQNKSEKVGTPRESRAMGGHQPCFPAHGAGAESPGPGGVRSSSKSRRVSPVGTTRQHWGCLPPDLNKTLPRERESSL